MPSEPREDANPLPGGPGHEPGPAGGSPPDDPRKPTASSPVDASSHEHGNATADGPPEPGPNDPAKAIGRKPAETAAGVPAGATGSAPAAGAADGEPADDAADGSLLEEAVNRYMEELADGRQPDQQAYLTAYPQLARSLRGVFKTLGFIEAAGKSLGAPTLEAGSRLGEFRILREIGRGGMGVVYEAVQTSLNRRVALKVLPPNVMLSPNALERFHREAQTGGRLHHTNIVPVYAVGEQQGINYYAMQFIEGRSLAYYLRTVRERPHEVSRDHFRRVARWGQQVAEALDHAHSQGVLHRDIKPANLMLDKQDNVWVFDFGLARIEDNPTITETGDLLGTVRYMSPEQAGGGRQPVDHRADIYSFGATLYELAAFVPAFEDESRARLLEHVIHEEPQPLRQIMPSIPRDLETIIQKCMRKPPDQRYQRALEIAEDLRRFIDGEPIRARPTPLHVRLKRWIGRHRWQTAACVLVLASIAIGSLANRTLRRQEGERCLKQAYEAILFDQEYQRGSERLDRAERLGMASATLHLYRGLIPLFNEQPWLAIPHLETARRLDPSDLSSCYALSRALFDSGDVHTGQRMLDQEGSRRPDTALGWFLRGLGQGRYRPSEGIACYDHALELQPDFVAAILERSAWRGVRLMTDGRREDLRPMLNDVDAVVVFRPNASLSYASRARAWLAAAAYAATQADLRDQETPWLANCRADLDRALKLRHPNDPRAFSLRGAFSRYVGDFKDSATAYGRALEIHRRVWGESNAPFVHARAVALHALGDVDAALTEITAASELFPGYYVIMLHQAILLAEQGQIDEARKVCRKTLLVQKSHATGLIFTAAVMSLLGASDEVRNLVGSLQERDPADLSYENLEGLDPLASSSAPPPGYLDELGYLSGDLDAEQLMTAAGKEPGRVCEASFLVALRELGAGRRATGVQALQTCLDTRIFIYGEHRFAQVFLERIKADPSWPRWIPVATQ